MSALLPPELSNWLEAESVSLDTDAALAAEVLPRLASAGVFGNGTVAEARPGGQQSEDVLDGVRAIAAVSEHSVAAGFVFWGHRCYTEYLLQSPNEALREKLLPDLLAGRVAGATGLSNAMKFLAGLEELQVSARPKADGFVLDGKLPWVTNLRPQGFHVAAAVSRTDGGKAFIASLAYDDIGLTRSADLDLMALRGSNTAAIAIKDVEIDAGSVIHPDANAWLPVVRPSFLGFQCGLSIGLARRALAEAKKCFGAGRGALTEPVAVLTTALAEQERDLLEGLRAGTFLTRPALLFQIRIALADIVTQAIGLELQGSGGKAYLAGPGAAFARRWREAAFIPVVTPTVVQLRTVLAAQRSSAA